MKTMFLFGSGADTDSCGNLKSGAEFAEAIITERYKNETVSLLGNKFKNFKFIYPQSSKLFIQTVYLNETDARKSLEKSSVDKCINYYNGDSSVSYKNDISPICSEWYKAIMSDKPSPEKDFFFTNAALCDSLDEKFNSLRYPNFNSNAKRIINVYTSIFVLMLKSVYEFDNDFEWSFKNVFNKLNKRYDIKYNSETYYSLLKQSGIDVKIATTNYTNITEEITGKEVVYLHGKLNWFEDLRKLSVYDCTDKTDIAFLEKNQDIIPFILIPSGVKPIICKRQILNFAKFISYLDESNLLIIVGYKFNSEDNHINSIICDWLNSGENHLIYLNYKNEVDFKNIKWAHEITKCAISTPEDIKKNFNNKIISISINKDNSHDVFSKCLEIIKNEEIKNVGF